MTAIALGMGVYRPATPVRSHLRMTKRGRAVLLSLVATPVIIAALAFGINAGSAVGTSSSTPLAKITVVGGETLWSVAKQIAPNSDPRDVVADIISVNRLNSADIYPGEQLAIPAQYIH
jgi:LysM domain